MTSTALRASRALELIGAVHEGAAESAADSPLVLATRDPRNLLVVEDAGAVVSACAVLERTFVVGGERLRVGLVGAVSTAPAHRGRGFASRLLESAERELAARGCALALLWAEDPRFYHLRGWRPIGAEDDYLLPPMLGARLPRCDSRLARPADAARLHELASAHPTRVERTLDEMRALLACRDMRVRVAEDGARISAYTCCGRGRDLQGVVHEWGGAENGVLGLLARELAELPSGLPGLFVMAPADAHGLRERLATLDVHPMRGILGLGKVLDRRALAELLLRRVAPLGRVELATNARGGSEVVLRGMRGGGVLSDDSLLAVLFSERGLRDDIDALGAAFGFDASRLPLAPFAFGLDGI
ncbi:MAG: GNAT family N-acetyltransferase [Planctomycetota bacterium]|nr:MAG: GNAT family N-acetyltransferase [Planctomycetota bacterium]